MIEFLILLLFVLVFAMLRRNAERIVALGRELEAVKADLRKAISSGAAPPAEIAPVVVAVPPEPEEVSEAAEVESQPEPEDVAAIPQLAASVAAVEESPAAAVPEQRRGESLEAMIGARWPVWVGGVALALGGLFLVRFTIEAGLIGPRVRLILAALFGLLLMAGGEISRRRLLPAIPARFSNAMIPGVLTAAGAVTLFGAAYAAYAIYGFIGVTTAFTVLALVALATVALSLLHGQALASLGLLASLVTPLLVASDAPNATALFGFLTLTWLAVNAASRLRGWTGVPALANIGIGIWALLYAGVSPLADPLPPAMMLVAAIAGSAFLWPGPGYRRAAGESSPAPAARPPLAAMLMLALAVTLPALAMLEDTFFSGAPLALLVFAALIASLASLGASRPYGFWPAVIASAAAIAGLLAVTSLPLLASGGWLIGQDLPPVSDRGDHVTLALGLGAAFTLLGLAFLWREGRGEPDFSRVWAFLAAAMPVILGAIGFIAHGALAFDAVFGIYGLGIGLILLFGSEWQLRVWQGGEAKIAGLLGLGAFAAMTFALHALTNGIVTTIGVAVLGFGFFLAGRFGGREHLCRIMVAALVVVFARIAWEPTLVGAASLGRTPFLNALTAGYGIPTALAVAAAWLMRDSTDTRLRNMLQALASIAFMLTLAVLVRHAMNGGVLDSRTPTLGEQSIYTLLTIGFSGILTQFDSKAPSPVFRIGSMLAGALATVNVLVAHIISLNPYFSGENTGALPFLNLLLTGYLLPAIAYGITAYHARGKRPAAYVTMLAVAGSVLAFLWATLSVRRFWHGQNIADWKGFLQSETYAYSVVWLLFGVALLALGSRLNARSLRLASAVLVLISVVKVFIIDMAHLEGILRALSFMGLGAVLIGIGLFYQRVLTGSGEKS